MSSPNRGTYARDTSVPVSRTQDEIRRTLERYGATGFLFGQSVGQGVVAFEMKSRRVKFTIPTPPDSDRKKDQKMRTAWRCLLLAIKAKLECVASGISTFEEEFLAHIVLPNGETIGHVMLPQIAETYSSGRMPPLLGGRT